MRRVKYRLKGLARREAKDEMSYTKGQTWGALKKAWKAYKIAKVQKDNAKLRQYAERIRTLQKELGLPQSKFPDLGIS